MRWCHQFHAALAAFVAAPGAVRAQTDLDGLMRG
jgi:hypothetical protein